MLPDAAGDVADWTMDKADIVTLSQPPQGERCVVTAVNPGTVIVKATAADAKKKSSTIKITVVRRVESLTVAGPSKVAQGGAAIRLTAAALPENATNKAVGWTSSDPTIASVNASGAVSGKKLGMVQITAKAKDGSEVSAPQVSVTVVKKATMVTVRPQSPPLAAPYDLSLLDDQIQLTAVVENGAGDADFTAIQDVRWTSSNPKVATVDNTGLVTGLKSGRVTITAAALDGSGKSGPYAIEFIKTVTGLAITNAPEVIRVPLGSTLALTAAITPLDATNQGLAWSLGPNSEAHLSIDPNKGVVRGLQTGLTTTVRVKSKDGKGVESPDRQIKVVNRAKSVVVEPENTPAPSPQIDLNSGVTTFQLVSTVNNDEGDALQDVTWSSNTPKVAAVSQSGLVTGRKVGRATITATAKDGSRKYGSYTVSVDRLSKEITIGDKGPVVAGNSAAYAATVAPASTTNKAVSWSVTSGGEYAGISTRGVLTSDKSLDHAVDVEITATAADGHSTGKRTIRLVPRALDVEIQLGGESVSSAGLYLPESKTLQLTALVHPSDALGGPGTVRWSSSNTKIARVNSDGLVTGLKAGSVTITATSLDGFRYDTLPLTVKNAASAPFDVQVDPVFPLLYSGLDGGEEIYWGRAEATGVELRENEYDAWSLTKVGHTGDADLSLSVESGYSDDAYTEIYYSDVSGEGTVEYELEYVACNGRYRKRVPITVTIEALPEDAPDGIAYLGQSPVSLSVDEPHNFDADDITLTSGAEPVGGGTEKSFYSYGGAGDHCRMVYGEDGDVTAVFSKAGRYIVYAVALYGDRVFTLPIEVNVGPGGASPIDLLFHQPYKALYTGEEGEEGYLASLYLDNYEMAADETCQWSIVPVSATGPVTMALAEEATDGPYNDIYYALGSGKGKVTYRVTATVGGQSDFVDVTVDVQSYPSSAPSGVKLPRTKYVVKAGDTVLFKYGDIGYKKGSPPKGVSVWRDYYLEYGGSGDGWSSVVTNWRSAGLRATFKEPGRYFLYAVLGVNNRQQSQRIEVEVTGRNGSCFDLTVDKPYGVFYANSDALNGPFATVSARNFSLDPSADDACEWEFEQIGGDVDNPPITLSLVPEDDTPKAYIDYQLNGDSGEVTYRATLTVGGFTDFVDIHVSVEDADGLDLPTGIAVPRTEYTARPGQVLKLYTRDIQFANGQPPEGATVSRSYELFDGDWDAVDATVKGSGEGEYLRLEFRRAARVRLEARISVNNCMYAREIVIDASDAQVMDPGLQPVIDEVLYLGAGAETQGTLGYVYANGVVLRDGEGGGLTWTAGMVEGEGDDKITVTVGESDWNCARLNYVIDGDATPDDVICKVTYAIDGLYAGVLYIEDFDLRASEELSVELPEAYDSIELAPGEEFTFYLDDLTLSGEDAPPDYELERDFAEPHSGIYSWEYGDSSYTFSSNAPGTYTVEAEVKHTNCAWSRGIPVVVRAP